MHSAPLPTPPRVTRGGNVPGQPAVSVIILVTDDTARLLTCLDSIRRTVDRSTRVEVIVLANGTAAAALRPLEAVDDIVLLRSDVNHGFGGGGNWAARFARADRLVFLNDDVVVQAGWLTGLTSAMDSDQRIAVVGSRVVLGDGRLQEAGSVVWRDASTSQVGRGDDPGRPFAAGPRDVDYVSFCSAMVRTSVWQAANGFDERYFPAYYEDADLCFAVRALGWRVVCEPGSVVVHEESASTTLPFRVFLSRRNQRLFAEKWAPVLSGRESRPQREHRAAAIDRSLDRLAREEQRVTQRGTTPSPAAAAPPRGAVGEEEALGTEVRHLRAHLAVLEAYVADERPASPAAETAVAASRLWLALRRLASQRLRRHPRLRRTVHRLTRADGAER